MKYHFDIKRITADPTAYDVMLISRGYEPASAEIINLDTQRRSGLTMAQDARSKHKELSGQVGKAMKAGASELANQLKERVHRLKSDMEWGDLCATTAERKLEDILLRLPNWPASDVPAGKGEEDNQEVKWWNVDGLGMKVRGARDGEAHWDMPHAADMGFDVAAKISGARFSMLSGGVARLHRALGQFMLDYHTDRGYREVIPPVIVKAQAMYGTGQLPKFEEDVYAARVNLPQGEYYDMMDERYLIPTSEVSLTNIHADEVISQRYNRYVALTDCFRAEAGSAGRDTRGLIRQHQFQKVEMVIICHPDESANAHEAMTRQAEGILEALELPYRRMLLCVGDMGFSAQKTYDLEVWLPGQNAYREISSISNCGDFQARRMNTRYKDGNQTLYAHTLNGSGLAVGRTLVAVLENYYLAGYDNPDIAIPKVLQPYMKGKTLLSQLSG